MRRLICVRHLLVPSQRKRGGTQGRLLIFCSLGLPSRSWICFPDAADPFTGDRPSVSSLPLLRTSCSPGTLQGLDTKLGDAEALSSWTGGTARLTASLVWGSPCGTPPTAKASSIQDLATSKCYYFKVSWFEKVICMHIHKCIYHTHIYVYISTHIHISPLPFYPFLWSPRS